MQIDPNTIVWSILVPLLVTISTLIIQSRMDLIKDRRVKRFDVEYSTYRELWKKLFALRVATLELRKGSNEYFDTQEHAPVRHKAYQDAWNEFSKTAEENRPFYSKDVYAALKALLKLYRKEGEGYPYAIMNDEKFWNNTHQNASAIFRQIDVVSEAIRKRLD